MLATPIKEFKLKETKLTILKSLGKGGFAEVYLAQDNNTKKLYALKKKMKLILIQSLKVIYIMKLKYYQELIIRILLNYIIQ